MNSEEAAEAEGGPDSDVTVAQYHASRARYIRTVTSGVEQRLMESVGKRRRPLAEEISNLTQLARGRYNIYQDALKAYAAKAPSRVKRGGLLPPSMADNMIGGISKLYKTALKAAEEFREVEGMIKNLKARLEEMDSQMREQVEQYGRSLIAQLGTPSGLQGAFMRDPLLSRAHARMLAAESRRASVRDSGC